MFNSKKEVKKMKYAPMNFLILAISVICGILAFYYLLLENKFIVGALSVGVALMFEHHLEYDLYNKD